MQHARLWHCLFKLTNVSCHTISPVAFLHLVGLVGQFAGIQDLVALHAGLPPAVSFPLASLSLQLSATPAHQSSSAASKEPPITPNITIAGPAMVSAQQYIFSSGYAPLVRWVKHTTQQAHNPPSSTATGGQPGWDVAITAGAVNALTLAVSLLCDPGDWVICDEFTYSHALEGEWLQNWVNVKWSW